VGSRRSGGEPVLSSLGMKGPAPAVSHAALRRPQGA